MQVLDMAPDTGPAPDSETQRRCRLLVIIAAGMALLALAFIPVVLATSFTLSGLITLTVAAAVFFGVALLGRSGRIDLGAYILIGVTIAAIVASFPAEAAISHLPFYMVLAVLLAGALLPPTHVWGVLTITIVGTALGAGLLPIEVRTSLAWRQALLGAPLLLFVVALITYLSARTASRALAAAEEAGRALAESNAALEGRVEERTAALRQVADEQRSVVAQLEASLAAQSDLNRVIAELSVPIIPISAGTLVVPLVGNLDSDRARQLLSAVLQHLEQTGARTVVLDVTGVVVVDTQVAGALLKVAEAARLMGADAMLVGIRPEVAQTLVHLGVDLGALHTAATLQDGLHTIGATRR